jgi:hypothetical protein
MEINVAEFRNPFRPGAGHMPPYLAGREFEKREFSRLLDQDAIFDNLVLSGLRGVGKTVLLETLKPIAIQKGWLWVGTDMSESMSVSESTLAVRLLTDLAVVTSGIAMGAPTRMGLAPTATEPAPTLDYSRLVGIFNSTPGLIADKLKAVLETVWQLIQPTWRGIVFAYDEAQNLADHPDKGEYPLALLLDLFQSIQRKDIRFVLVLTGLPTLFPKLVEARTFAERMFHNVFLDRLNETDTRDAILKPIADTACPVNFSAESVEAIYEFTLGYPYFIQYVCREVFDVWTQNVATREELRRIPLTEITQKLDSDFFAGRWARATDRQRDLLGVIARLDITSPEFTVQEIAEKSAELLSKPFSPSSVNQMLAALGNAGLVYKNRWGKYSFAVPLLDRFIRRQLEGPSG